MRVRVRVRYAGDNGKAISYESKILTFLNRKGATTRSRLLGIASPDFCQFVGIEISITLPLCE